MNKQTTKTKARPQRDALTDYRKNGTHANYQEERENIPMLEVQVEGRRLDLPQRLAGKDKTLREALLTLFPKVATATFDRKTAGIVKVCPKAGANGSVSGGFANDLSNGEAERFSKEELERIVLWRAIFGAMEKEEKKAKR